MNVFGNYSFYYDALYRDKDYPREARFVHGVIRKHAPQVKAILDLGCGTGVHAEYLAGMGYRVHGVDVSPSMIQLARRRKQEMPAPTAGLLSFAEGDIRTCAAGQSFDCVTALFHVVSYQNTYEDLRAVFHTAHNHLTPGGLFLFDFWHGPAVLRDAPAARIKRWEDGQTEVIRLAEPVMHAERNVVDVNYTLLVKDKGSGAIEEIRETHCMRYWFLPELVFFLSEEGFALREAGEWMTAAAPSANSWSVYLAALR